MPLGHRHYKSVKIGSTVPQFDHFHFEQSMRDIKFSAGSKGINEYFWTPRCKTH